jgi:hypothetical protein
MTTTRTLLLIGAAIVALMAITIVVVVAAGGRTVQQYPADTPEGTMQRYLTAFDDGDYEAAYAYFSDDVHATMTLDDFETAIDNYGSYFGEGSPARQVSFDRVTGDEDRVQVHLVVEEFSGEGLTGNSYRSEREIRLVRQSDGWRIDESLVWLDPAPSFEFAA